eukprot:TRINITY_DN96090_c0_g1_i1.p2 TRINITY_DN96090_c0_g1~~TRINITY_DN96090_c0_g1_i1.p2  ORF type:complete len:180 (-),score=34.63 TRINITY_DN96090_c0_g1_i1:146-658(-)
MVTKLEFADGGLWVDLGEKTPSPCKPPRQPSPDSSQALDSKTKTDVPPLPLQAREQSETAELLATTAPASDTTAAIWQPKACARGTAAALVDARRDLEQFSRSAREEVAALTSGIQVLEEQQTRAETLAAELTRLVERYQVTASSVFRGNSQDDLDTGGTFGDEWVDAPR